jgi:hypothetical protein
MAATAARKRVSQRLDYAHIHSGPWQKMKWWIEDTCGGEIYSDCPTKATCTHARPARERGVSVDAAIFYTLEAEMSKGSKGVRGHRGASEKPRAARYVEDGRYYAKNQQHKLTSRRGPGSSNPAFGFPARG